MKSKLNLNTILIALAILFAGSWSAYSQRQTVTPAPTKWAYTICLVPHEDAPKLDQILNEYGRDGWELTGMSVPGGDQAGFYFFKRPIQ